MPRSPRLYTDCPRNRLARRARPSHWASLDEQSSAHDRRAAIGPDRPAPAKLGAGGAQDAPLVEVGSHSSPLNGAAPGCSGAGGAAPPLRARLAAATFRRARPPLVQLASSVQAGCCWVAAGDAAGTAGTRAKTGACKLKRRKSGTAPRYPAIKKSA